MITYKALTLTSVSGCGHFYDLLPCPGEPGMVPQSLGGVDYRCSPS